MTELVYKDCCEGKNSLQSSEVAEISVPPARQIGGAGVGPTYQHPDHPAPASAALHPAYCVKADN